MTILSKFIHGFAVPIACLWGRKRVLVRLGAVLGVLVVLAGVHRSRLPHGRLVIDFLDVGQGDALLITTPDRRVILVDGGPNQVVLEELGDVMPFLQRRIDLIVLTHPHADHMMGLIQVVRRYEVGAVLFSGVNYESFLYDAFLNEIQRRSIPLYVAQAHKDWSFGPVTLDVLYPLQSMAGQDVDNVNNASVVVMVTYRHHRILLMGDAEHEVESELLEAYTNPPRAPPGSSVDASLNADVLKVGHHGSRTSSTVPFLEAVTPEIAVIACGAENDFGHPHQETLDRLEALGVEVRRNDREGRIRLVFE